MNKKLKYIGGRIVKVDAPSSKDIEVYANFTSTLPEWTSIDPILRTEGWLSRSEPDRISDVLPGSAWLKDLDDFLKYPMLFFNHDSDQVIGIWTDLQVREEGLYGKNLIVGTEKGKEVAMLINAGVLRGYSVGFNPINWEPREDGGYLYSRAALIEGSIVSVPMHLLATVENVEEIVEETLSAVKSYTTNTFNIVNKTGDKTMPGTEKPAPTLEELEALGQVTKEQGVAVSSLGEKYNKMAQMLSEMKQTAESYDGNISDLRQLIDNATGDFKKYRADVDEAIKEVKTRATRTVPTGMEGLSLKEMVTNYSASEIRGSLPVTTAEQVLNIQKLHDDTIMIDALMEASSKANAGDYHNTPRNQRIKGLKIYKRLNNFAKAMDTQTSSEGSDWIPTGMSTQFVELISIDLKVAPLFAEVIMPTATFEIDTDGDDTIATLAGESTAVISAFNSTEETPGTGKITLTAKKARGRYQISTELNEDSATAIMPFAIGKITKSLSRAEDRAIVNGDITTSGTGHFDSGHTVAASDFRHAWDGLRYHWYVSINGSSAGTYCGTDLSTFNEDGVNEVRAKMGKYGLYPSELAWIASVETYLLHLLKDLDNFQTLEKYGPNAVVLSGELGRMYNAPVIVSEFVEATQNASGIYDGVTTDNTSLICVNRDMFLRGTRRSVEVLVDKNILDDVYNVVAHKRMAFAPKATPSSTLRPVSIGYNISSS